MTKANELRIGNWLRDYYGVYRKVAYVGEVIGLHNDIGGTDRYQNKPIFSNNLKDLHPIPLTPEILEKAGFEYKEDNTLSKWYELNGIELMADEIGYCCYFSHYMYPTVSAKLRYPMQHLHELQNLYFALTGEELNIEL